MIGYIRQMNFRPTFSAEITGKISGSAMAILVVNLGGGYWAIATGSVLSSLAPTLISYLLAPYRPALSLSRLSEFSTFMGWFSSAQLLSALSWQFDRALLGYFVSKSDLGQYSMASDLAVLPSQSLIGPAMAPVMAAFSTIKDNHQRVRKAYLKASWFTMMLAAPVCLGMSLTSDLIVHVLLGGAKWNQAAVYLQWLSLATVLTAYYNPLYSLALALDRPSALLRLTAIELSLRIVLISSGLYFYSIMGAVVARGLISIIMFVAILASARTLTGISMAVQIQNLWKIGLSCAVMALPVIMLRYELSGSINPIVELGIASVCGSAVYVGALFSLGSRWQDFSKPWSDR